MSTVAVEETDLESRALRQFDKLVQTGDLFWEENEVRIVPAEPFNFHFRVTDTLARKPMTRGSSEKNQSPFVDNDPDFDLAQIEGSHKLILNKFCAVRPQFVLPTLEYKSQEEFLDQSDFQAAWSVINELRSQYLAIYNCGANAGRSVEHKHLQVLPQPEYLEQAPFLPLEGRRGGIYLMAGLPFQHAFHALPDITSGSSLFEIYTTLLDYLNIKPGSAHNVILTKKWLLVIPRSKGRLDYMFANAAGMVGLVWCAFEPQYQSWLNYGPMRVLRELGVPMEKAEL